MNKFRVLKVELNQAAVRSQILKAPETAAACRKIAQDIQGRAGAGYELSEFSGRNRVNVSVGVATKEAYQDNLANNTLLKAMR